MPRAMTLLIFLVAVTGAALADPLQSRSDPRPLSQNEMQIFLPLVCLNPAPDGDSEEATGDTDFNCQRLIGYRDADRGDISLSAVAYGAFTGPGAHEAYLSYSSGREPHANDGGGGILFTSSGKHWRLVRWYPGRAMEKCLALPGQGQQRMLCLVSHVAQGETDSSVWVEAVGSGQDVSLLGVLKAQDDRAALDPDEASAESYPCMLGGHTHKAMLLSIDSFDRSPAATEFARSRITYAAARDVEVACKSGHFEDVRTTNGIAQYRIKDGNVVVSAPEVFSKTDY